MKQRHSMPLIVLSISGHLFYKRKFMIFNDIKDIRECLDTFAMRLTAIEMLQSSMERVLFCEDEGGTISRLHDKLDTLLDDEKSYIENIERLNNMVNELKGMVAIVRSSLK